MRGTEHIFGVTGGAVVHLFDSADKNPKISPIYTHHEQAASLAAVAYSKIKHGLGVCIVTTGPAGTNALTGVLAAWQDSVPCLFLSGQARIDHISHGKNLRQLGTQEFDIITTVKHMCKYAKMIERPEDIRHELEKAYHLANDGRPGPVWLDLPLNFQWAEIDPHQLPSFERKNVLPTNNNHAIQNTIEALLQAQRPIVLAGYGLHLSQAEEEFHDFVQKSQIPWVSTWTAADLIQRDDLNYCGRIGISGQRGANLALQNSDLLIVLGSQLLIPHTGTVFENFARAAKIIRVDIIPKEDCANTVKIDLHIQSDLKTFLPALNQNFKQTRKIGSPQWSEQITKYQALNQDHTNDCDSYFDPYHVVNKISDALQEEDFIVIDGGGTALYISFQAFRLKHKNRMICSSAISAMGTGLPEAIGVSFAGNRRKTICTIGDGSMQFNIQELQTIREHQLPIKVFIFNNNGYLAIRHTQDGFLSSNYTGTHPDFGLSMPDFSKIADAYGIQYTLLQKEGNLDHKIQEILADDKPQIVEFMIDPQMKLKMSQGFQENADGTFSPRPLEDMAPCLPDEQFKNLMLIPHLRKGI